MTENLPSLLPSQAEFQMFQVMARNAQTSGLYGGVGGEAKIFMVLLAARELGISPMLALNGGIWNIQGKIEISARLMNSMIRRAGHSITIKKSDDRECILLGKRTDGDTFECSFTIEDATKAGLSSRDVWKKYAADMLYNRCMSRLARRLFPDVIGCAYVQGEISDSEELQQAECEDVTKSNICPTLEEVALEMPKAEVISFEQVTILSELYSQVDASCKANLDRSLEKIGVKVWNDLPTKHYEFYFNGMTANVKKQKEVVS